MNRKRRAPVENHLRDGILLSPLPPAGILRRDILSDRGAPNDLGLDCCPTVVAARIRYLNVLPPVDLEPSSSADFVQIAAST